jgi:hypothetical protein
VQQGLGGREFAWVIRTRPDVLHFAPFPGELLLIEPERGQILGKTVSGLWRPGSVMMRGFASWHSYDNHCPRVVKSSATYTALRQIVETANTSTVTELAKRLANSPYGLIQYARLPSLGVTAPEPGTPADACIKIDDKVFVLPGQRADAVFDLQAWLRAIAAMEKRNGPAWAFVKDPALSLTCAEQNDWFGLHITLLGGKPFEFRAIPIPAAMARTLGCRKRVHGRCELSEWARKAVQVRPPVGYVQYADSVEDRRVAEMMGRDAGMPLELCEGLTGVPPDMW